MLLQGNPDHGLPVYWFNDFGQYSYDFSFWYMSYRGNDGCQVSIPEMMGYGGNLVTLMPNGMTGIRLADADQGTPGMWDGKNVAGDLTHRAERVLDDRWCRQASAGVRAAGSRRMTVRNLVQPLQDAARDARFLMLQTPGQVAHAAVRPCLRRPGPICRRPDGAPSWLDARMQMQGQALDDVTALVDLAALDDTGGHTEPGRGLEVLRMRFAERLRAIDDQNPAAGAASLMHEQPLARRCTASNQGLDDATVGVLRRPLDHGPGGRMYLIAVARHPDADRRHAKTWSPTVRETVDLDDFRSRSSSERSEASQAFILALRDSATKRRETFHRCLRV